MAQDDIQGQVVDPSGNPVSGAIVELTRSYESNPVEEQTVRRTTTDSNGNYIFETHPDGDGTTQDYHVSCYNYDGTAYVNSNNNPGVTAALPSNAIPDGGLFRWTFDSSDISGSTITDIWGDNNATNNGATTGASGLATNYNSGEAISYNGSSDFTEHTTLDDFGSNLDSDWAFGFWIKGSTLDGNFGVESGPKIAIEFGSAAFNTSAFQLKLLGLNKKNVIFTNQNVDDGNAHLIGWQSQGNGSSSDEIELYIDGAQANTSIAKNDGDLTDVQNFSDPFVMGAFNSEGNIKQFMDCEIDDLRFFNRSLSGTEWSNWFNTGSI